MYVMFLENIYSLHPRIIEETSICPTLGHRLIKGPSVMNCSPRPLGKQLGGCKYKNFQHINKNILSHLLGIFNGVLQHCLSDNGLALGLRLGPPDGFELGSLLGLLEGFELGLLDRLDELAAGDRLGLLLLGHPTFYQRADPMNWQVLHMILQYPPHSSLRSFHHS